jgi:hypothetical protein
MQNNKMKKQIRVLKKLSKLGFRPALNVLEVDRLWETEGV